MKKKNNFFTVMFMLAFFALAFSLLQFALPYSSGYTFKCTIGCDYCGCSGAVALVWGACCGACLGEPGDPPEIYMNAAPLPCCSECPLSPN